MARGTLVLVVGPSGVGKDSIIAGAAERLRADPRHVFPRRLITRPETAGGEPHVALSPAEFAARRDGGGLLLDWRAHGLDYGLPRDVDTELDAGRCVVANVSRTVVAEARRRFAPVAVVAIAASPETLAARLSARGREDAADIERRLHRAVSAEPPDVTIDNDGTLGEAVERFVGILRTLQPASG
jgi:phosphonate metabolism protein PhnN/1,5-bisphosphokinase (PRPP-forming)